MSTPPLNAQCFLPSANSAPQTPRSVAGEPQLLDPLPIHSKNVSPLDCILPASKFYSDGVLAQLDDNLLDMVPTEFSRVLVIYTGGTIGMQNCGEHGYAPVPDYLCRVLASNPRFHCPHDAKDTKSPGTQTALPPLFNRLRRSPTDIAPEIIPALITPPSLWDKRILYSFLEYDPLLDSCNMTHNEWIKIATDIELNYEYYDAFLILHGTDTMAFTASALSFLLENLAKTVIMTGSQIPLHESRNDAVENLLGSLTIAGHYVIPEVAIYFNNRLLRGNRCTKVDAVSFSSFDSPNFPPLVNVGVNIDVKWDVMRRSSLLDTFTVHHNMNPNVACLRLFPGISEASVRAFLQPPISGVILETFGAGHAPDNRPELLRVFREACERGVVIVNCTQCSRGFVADLYKTGKDVTRAGVVPGADMTRESAFTKLSYLLAEYPDNVSEVRRLMRENLRGELTPRTTSSKFSLGFHELSLAEIIIPARGNIEAQEKCRGSGGDCNSSNGYIGGGSSNSNNSSNNYFDDISSSRKTNILTPQLMLSVLAAKGIRSALPAPGKFPSLRNNVIDFSGYTPIHHAVASGSIETVELVIQNYSQPSNGSANLLDRYGCSPLRLAIKTGRYVIAAQLLVRGYGLAESEMRSAALEAFNACGDGNLYALSLYLRSGIDVNQTNSEGRTLLHTAVASQNPSVVEFLLGYSGINLRILDRFGMTASQNAATICATYSNYSDDTQTAASDPAQDDCSDNHSDENVVMMGSQSLQDLGTPCGPETMGKDVLEVACLIRDMLAEHSIRSATSELKL